MPNSHAMWYTRVVKQITRRACGEREVKWSGWKWERVNRMTSNKLSSEGFTSSPPPFLSWQKQQQTTTVVGWQNQQSVALELKQSLNICRLYIGTMIPILSESDCLPTWLSVVVSPLWWWISRYYQPTYLPSNMQNGREGWNGATHQSQFSSLGTYQPYCADYYHSEITMSDDMRTTGRVEPGSGENDARLSR